MRNAPSSRFAALDWLACSVSEATSELPLTDAIVNAQAGPQGMSFEETGPRGAMLLEVDAQRRIKQTLIPLAPVRWERITQSLDGVRNRDDLLERMLAAVERLSDLPGELLRFIDWKLDRTSGEANGWEADAAVTELSAALTQLTDQPEGLRYVHRVRPLDPDVVLSTTRYGNVEFCSSLQRANIMACQFHPDRSGPAGLKIYQTLAKMVGVRPKE